MKLILGVIIGSGIGMILNYPISFLPKVLFLIVAPIAVFTICFDKQFIVILNKISPKLGYWFTLPTVEQMERQIRDKENNHTK